jgi:hypothetical protein
VSGVIAQSFQHRFVAQRIHPGREATVSFKYGKAEFAALWSRLNLKAKLETLFDQAGQAGAPLGGQCLCVCKQWIVDVQRGLRQIMIQKSVLS